MGIVSANRKAFEKFETRPKPAPSDSSRTLMATPPVSPSGPPFRSSVGSSGGGGCTDDESSPRPRSHKPSARLRLKARPHHPLPEGPMTNDEKIDSLMALLDKPVVVNPSFPETIRHRHDWEDLEWRRGDVHDDEGHRSSTDSASTGKYDDMVDSLLTALEETGI